MLCAHYLEAVKLDILLNFAKREMACECILFLLESHEVRIDERCGIQGSWPTACLLPGRPELYKIWALSNRGGSFTYFF